MHLLYDSWLGGGNWKSFLGTVHGGGGGRKAGDCIASVSVLGITYVGSLPFGELTRLDNPCPAVALDHSSFGSPYYKRSDRIALSLCVCKLYSYLFSFLLFCGPAE